MVSRSTSSSVSRSASFLLFSAVLGAALVGCAEETVATRTPTPATSATAASEAPDVAGEAVATPGSSLTRPDWLPSALPLPAGAQITGISTDGGCNVLWIVSGADARVVAADVVEAGRAAGVKASVTSTSEGGKPVVLDPWLGEDEVPLTPDVQMVGVRLSVPADSTPAAGSDVTGGFTAELALSGISGGVVQGDYRLPASACEG